MEIVSGKDEWVCRWVVDRMPGFTVESLKPCSTIGFVKEGYLIAGAVFNNYRPMAKDIQLTIVADTPLWTSKTSLRAIFNYVFNQLECNRFTVTIAKNNKRARKLAEGVGFVYEGNARKGYDGINDAIIYGMLRDECRWLGDKEYGKEYTISA